ncbi:MAG: hypothetical protein D6748_08050 [Calditrichaeota bacterium]|nr:MAG: hypothetical protein D6748_08050 [Calditrichota bacterium]
MRAAWVAKTNSLTPLSRPFLNSTCSLRTSLNDGLFMMNKYIFSEGKLQVSGVKFGIPCSTIYKGKVQIVECS